MTPVQTRRARPDEREHLTQICVRATQEDGYDTEFIGRAMPVLTVDIPSIASGLVLVAEDDQGVAIGLVSVRPSGYDGLVLLDRIFVDPTLQRRGIGRQLFGTATELASKLGGTAILINSNPTAAGFYVALGAIRIGEGRFFLSPDVRLPIFVFPIPNQ